MKIMPAITLFLLISTGLGAQNPETDLKKVLNLLTQSNNLYFTNTYYYYQEGQSTPSDSLYGIYQKNNTMEYARMGSVEVMAVDHTTVSVDHEERVMAVRQSGPEQSMDQLFDPTAIKALVQKHEVNTRFLDAGPGSRKILIEDPENAKQQVQLKYDPQTWIIQEVRITGPDPFSGSGEEQPDNITMVVQYHNFSIAPRAFPYRLDQYFRKEGEHYKAIGKYKGYQII